ncbi:bifunctional metallophosphatase/5'-nucleotidase [Variovorax ginsengisoli]|uniref:5'-nucleotidase n=1 Tax=Variovorax ginsengisoli TaxID=363844 RepID=A0ABT9S3Q4_9BURK|nr:bifunctional metallophosphatase/5'-nucleotidase [Variovorax ginsengisoli]MDP9898426.1 5'-nucleotidase [Variovorax ginsengisoli]
MGRPLSGISARGSSSARSSSSAFSSIAAALLALTLLGACTAPATPGAPGELVDAPPPGMVDVTLIAFNDLHGNLEPPLATVNAPGPMGRTVQVPAGGAAYMASAIAALKARNPNHAVVSAGDMIGASPLVSALFLDEPTIEAVNAMHIDFNAMGNHEFDKGRAELVRMQQGGCVQHTLLQPCRLNPAFAGANFGFLAANTVREDGGTLFPATGLKTFTQNGATVKVGFIGMTLRATPSLVTPAGVAGLRFDDEADTANALVAPLKAQGADAIVVLLHEGGSTQVGYNDKRCAGLSGDIVPILSRLSPEIDVVVSGHTHQAYLCDLPTSDPSRRRLLTSAGLYGTLLTDIRLRIDARTHRVVTRSADQVIVQGEPFTRAGQTVALNDRYPVFSKDPDVATLVARYAAAAQPLAQRVVGRLGAPLDRRPSASGESTLGNFIADGQLAATRAPEAGGAQLAFTNRGGMREDLVPAPDGTVRYGQLFSVQPFGNSMVVKTFTGAQIRRALEQQFDSGTNTVQRPRVLMVSEGFHYAFDLQRAPGERISELRLNGVALQADGRYRVAMNSFLAAGGDNFTVFTEGTEVLGGAPDLEALERHIHAQDRAGHGAPAPATDRILNLTRGTP